MRCPKPRFTIPLVHKNRSNPFDSVPLATLSFEFLTSEQNDLAKFLADY